MPEARAFRMLVCLAPDPAGPLTGTSASAPTDARRNLTEDRAGRDEWRETHDATPVLPGHSDPWRGDARRRYRARGRYPGADKRADPGRAHGAGSAGP